MNPYKHQNEIREEERTRLLLAWDTGTGKTYGAELLLERWDVKALIIVPKAQKEKWEYLEEQGSVVVTKEYFRDHLTEMLTTAVNKNLEALIIDEAHFFAGIKSGMTKALNEYNKKINPEYRWLLTATPVLSTPWNVFTLGKHLGFEPNYDRFRKMFFARVKMGNRYIWKPLTKTTLNGKTVTTKSLLHQILLKFTIWVDFEDVARDNGLEYDISKQTKKVHLFHQPLEQVKRQIRLTEEGIALWTKKHTVQNGFYDDEYLGVEYYEDPKLIHILSTAKKQKKMAVVCRYHRQIDRYKEVLEQEGYNVHIIKGGVKNIENYCKELDAMDEVIVIIQANVSEGYELPSFPYAIFASLSFSYKDFKQMNGRFLRVNAITPTHTEILLMVDGIDIDVYKNISNKQDFYIADMLKK